MLVVPTSSANSTTTSTSPIVRSVNDRFRIDRRVRAQDEADRLGRLRLATGQLSAVQTTRLEAILEGLAGLYERHIQVEESEVFPLLNFTQ